MLNYEKVDNTLGPFTEPGEKMCFNISILDNYNCTEPMNFIIIMSPHNPSADNVTIIDPVTTVVIDDSREPECSK